jgi:hypothetical protein
MGKAKRKLQRHKIEVVHYQEKEKKDSVFSQFKSYFNFKWLSLKWQTTFVLTLAFLVSSFLVAYPLGLLLDNYYISYVIVHGVLTSLVVVLYSSKGEKKAKNLLDFLIRWLILGTVLALISFISISR